MEDFTDLMRRKADPRLADLDPPPPPCLTWAGAYDVFIHARDVLMLIVARFLSPIALGEDSRMSVVRRREFLSWLRPVELMLRRLLFIEASALAATLPAPQPATPTQPRASTPTSRAYKPPSPDPQDWTASFKVYEDAASSPNDSASVRAGSPRYRARLQDEDICDGRSLAVRLEAVLRVVADLTPHIRRLALRIQRTGRRAFVDLTAPADCHNWSLRETLADLAEAIGPLIAAEDSS